VAIQRGSDLWLTMWVRCSPKGEIFIMYPRADVYPRVGRSWNPHASYHSNGTLHQKTHDVARAPQKRQPLTATFKGREYLGAYLGHGESMGAVCDPTVFDGLIIVAPGVLDGMHGSVAFDLVEPGYELKPDPNIPDRRLFPRGHRPSVVITVRRAGQEMMFLNWPDDFIKVA